MEKIVTIVATAKKTQFFLAREHKEPPLERQLCWEIASCTLNKSAALAKYSFKQ